MAEDVIASCVGIQIKVYFKGKDGPTSMDAGEFIGRVPSNEEIEECVRRARRLETTCDVEVTKSFEELDKAKVELIYGKNGRPS